MRMSVISTYEKRGGVKSVLCFLLAFLIAFLGIFIWINIKMRPLVTGVTKAYAENIVSYVINDLTREKLREEDYSFIDIQKDGEGKVIALNMNAIDANLFRSRIAVALKDRISSMEIKEAKIPLGNFTRQPFLSGLGPKITVRFLMLPSSEIEINESFSSKGINQTIYTVSLDVTTDVSVYIPTMSSSIELKTGIPIAQTVIVGQVPDSYTHVSGVEGDPEDIVLDIKE